MRILVVEDDPKMAGLLLRGLTTEEGSPPTVAANGEDAVWMAGATEYDAIVLDVMLPGIDGFEACRRLRVGRRLDAGPDADRARRASRTASPASTAAPTTTSPSRSPSRSCSRACARSSRRGPVERPTVLVVGDLRLDPARAPGVARRDADRPLGDASSRCSRRSCAAPAGSSPASSSSSTSGTCDYENRSNVVDVYVRYLREKIDRPFGVVSIETVRGSGYTLRADGGC